ncbi:transferrin-binding protein-like solute binding protein [Neisseria gonorrhoeae]
MNNPLVNQAAMVLPVFLLSACLGGGGSFDLDSVDTEAPRAAPKYQDVPSKKPEARKDQGGYGFAMRFKRRSWYLQANPKEDKIPLSENDWEQTDNGDIKNPSKQKNIINALSGNGGASLQDSSRQGEGISKVTGYHDFKYVWSGFFYKQIGSTIKRDDSSSKIIEARNGPDGYIFYKGKDPSRKLPVSGIVEYKGTWDFLTDVRVNQKFTDLGSAYTRSGDRYSAFSGELDYIVKKEDDKKEKHKGLGLTTEITVDFEQKTLNGKLIKNNHVIGNVATENKYTTEYYTLGATLRGNRFSGTATATDKSSDGQAKQHPFVSDSSSLSGGFFGPKGEELGFRFLSDDQKVAVVGSAKTRDKAENGGGNGASGGASVSASNGAAGMPSENGKLTTVLDAVELESDGKKVKNLDNFSDATRLVVDGIMIPLLPTESGNGQADKGKNGGTDFTYTTTYTPESDKKDIQAQAGAGGMQTASGTAGVNGGQAGAKTYKVQVCCSNLNYLKYGLLTRENNNSVMQAVKNSDQTAARTAQGAQSMFLQGERTDENKIPQGQDIVYLGSWYGYIANGTNWSGKASNKEAGNKAEFTVNFDQKQITGKLTAENRSEATFTIKGMIQGNGFEGTAKTGDGGFAPDQNNSTVTHKVHIADAKVRGGFYGPNAEELGGWFAYPGNGQAKNAQTSSGNGNSASSATVVFGAKRQELVK